MLFSKKIEPRCAYCQRGANLSESEVMCLRKGIVSASSQCRRFKYDPLKRVPPKPQALTLPKFSEEDFAL